MQRPPPRQHRIVGGDHAALEPHTASHGALARSASVENPFASFYESRRKISLEAADDDDSADPSSSITRAYIVPDALLALARGERDSHVSNSHVSNSRVSNSRVSNSRADAGPVGDGSTELARFVATAPVDVATGSPRILSASRFRFRSPPALGLGAEWRAVQRIALQMVGWLRRTWRRSIPN